MHTEIIKAMKRDGSNSKDLGCSRIISAANGTSNTKSYSRKLQDNEVSMFLVD